MSKELEALRKIGLMTTKRNLQDFPIGNQPKQIVKMKIKEMPEFQEVINALTERDIYYQALCDIESGKDVRMILERVLTLHLKKTIY